MPKQIKIIKSTKKSKPQSLDLRTPSGKPMPF